MAMLNSQRVTSGLHPPVWDPKPHGILDFKGQTSWFQEGLGCDFITSQDNEIAQMGPARQRWGVYPEKMGSLRFTNQHPRCTSLRNPSEKPPEIDGFSFGGQSLQRWLKSLPKIHEIKCNHLHSSSQVGMDKTWKSTMNFQLKWETHLQMAELWLQFLIARVSPRISISKQMSHQNSTSSMGVQASPTYYLAFWLGSPLPQSHPTMADRPLFAHQIPISVKLKLSRILNFSFCWKKSVFFSCLGQLPRCFSHIPFFLLVKSPCSPVNFIPWAPGAPPREIQQPFRREARQAIGAHEEQLLEEPRTGPTGTVAAGDPLLAKLKCLVSSMDWFKIYGKP